MPAWITPCRIGLGRASSRLPSVGGHTTSGARPDVPDQGVNDAQAHHPLRPRRAPRRCEPGPDRLRRRRDLQRRRRRGGDYPSGAVEMYVGASAGGSQRPDQPRGLQGPLRRARRVVPGDQQRGRQRRAGRRRSRRRRARRLDDRDPERLPLRHHPARGWRGRGHQHRRLRRRPGRLPRRLRHGRQPRQRLLRPARTSKARPRRSPTAPPVSAPAPSCPAPCCSAAPTSRARPCRSTAARPP